MVDLIELPSHQDLMSPRKASHSIFMYVTPCDMVQSHFFFVWSIRYPSLFQLPPLHQAEALLFSLSDPAAQPSSYSS